MNEWIEMKKSVYQHESTVSPLSTTPQAFVQYGCADQYWNIYSFNLNFSFWALILTFKYLFFLQGNLKVYYIINMDQNRNDYQDLNVR